MAEWAFGLKFQFCGGKRSWFIFELKREFYIEFRVLLMTKFLEVEEAFIPHDTNLVSWLVLLLFREEFGMLLT